MEEYSSAPEAFQDYFGEKQFLESRTARGGAFCTISIPVLLHAREM